MNLVLQLVDEAAARAIISGDGPTGFRCTEDFPASGDQIAAKMFLQRLDAGLDPRPFGIFLVIADDVVVGGAGFHGEPDDAGQVEIGYGIVESERGRGHATRALELLIERARDLGAVTLVAEIDLDNAASRKVVGRCGFVADSSSPTLFTRPVTR